ncbi:MAG: hypothetical protein Q4F13_09570 [Pseudomonadota bacterium]|nr:hypothetical protein [Pseudomonadota bacterium]
MTAAAQARLARQTAELHRAVPQVVAMRLGRLLGAGPLPGPAEQQEIYRMGAEKVAAFGESWLAMAAQSWAAQQRLAQWWLGTWWRVALGGWTNPPSVNHLLAHTQQHLLHAWLDTATHGMAPMHRRATANARRLRKASRTPRASRRAEK